MGPPMLTDSLEISLALLQIQSFHLQLIKVGNRQECPEGHQEVFEAAFSSKGYLSS